MGIVTKRKQNKKAMFFTILAITILSLFLISYSFYSIVKDRTPINKRIKTMNNFVFSVEQDIPRRLYISGFRVLFLFEKRIAERGEYITNVSSTFEETFFNGTIYGENQSLMNGATFSDILEQLNDNADKINAGVNLLNPRVSITQEDPWNVKVSLTVDSFIEDNSGLIFWNKTYTTSAYIELSSFEDPLYTIETNGLVSNKINKTIYDNFATGINVGNLSLHNANSYYIASSSAPSFLDRMEGRNNPNVNGIESLVHLPTLSGRGIAIKDKSVVDYIYFSSNNPTDYSITGMDPWFKLDNESNHLEVYNVSHLVI